MENKLEQLLNSLIEKGWKPFGKGKKRKVFARGDKTVSFSYQDDEGIEFYTYLIRDVVSKESGLRQFVCENGMTTLQIEYNNRKTPERGVRYHWNKHSNVIQEDERLAKERKRNENYEYRLIESALCDEDKLEEFLLRNIKVGNE